MLSKKIIAFLICVCLLGSFMVACSKGNTSNTKDGSEGNTVESSSSANSETKDSSSKDDVFPEPLELPIVDEPITLTIWRELGFKAATVMTTWNDMACFKEIEKITNVKLDFMHPPVGGEAEQLNTMIASRNLPDVILTGWDNLTGGPSRMISEGIIIPLNDYIDKYAPNLLKLWEEHPNWRIDVMTDEGDYYSMPCYWGEEENCHFGFVIRDDWADKLGVKYPENVDEWYTYLTAVKQNDPNGNGKNDEIPYAGVGLQAVKNFLKAFGIREDSLFYVENGAIACAVEQPEYKEWLSTMAKWYKEGLIDPEILSTDRPTLDSKVLSEVAGSLWSGAGTGQLGLYLKQMENKGNTEFSLRPVKHPTTAKGERLATYKTLYGQGAGITTKCEYPKEAVKYFDYFFTEEGRLLSYFGPEGEAYNIVDGEIVFTDYVMNNPDGLSFDSALIQKGAAPWDWVGVQMPMYWEVNTSFYPQQKEAYPLWSDVTVDKQLPILRFTVDESSTIAAISNDINNLLNETVSKIILGQLSVDEFDKTVEQLNGIGLQDLKKIYEGALQRYYARGEK